MNIDDVMGWGRYPTLSYRAAAARNPAFILWAAKTLDGNRGALCAEALAVHLGVVE